MAFKFEKLEVWQESIELTGIVHEVTCKFPKAELYVLTSQMKRAADSVCLNIAEGSTGQSNPEYRKFLRYAIRSAIEVAACIYVAKRRTIISAEDFQQIYNFTDQLVKRIRHYLSQSSDTWCPLHSAVDCQPLAVD
jgi:four helix bundle protein